MCVEKVFYGIPTIRLSSHVIFCFWSSNIDRSPVFEFCPFNMCFVSSLHVCDSVERDVKSPSVLVSTQVNMWWIIERTQCIFRVPVRSFFSIFQSTYIGHRIPSLHVHSVYV